MQARDHLTGSRWARFNTGILIPKPDAGLSAEETQSDGIFRAKGSYQTMRGVLRAVRSREETEGAVGKKTKQNT